MRFSTAAVTAFLLSIGSASAFSVAPSSTFVSSHVSAGASPTVAVVAPHQSRCTCAVCSRRSVVVLHAEPITESAEIPPAVEVLDGVDSNDEAHNSERPARKSLKKKGPRGKPLSEFKVGDAIKAKVRALASYGAFIDIGAQTDGLLHISQLAVGFVSDVSEVLQVGQEVDVRITNIDEKKNQVALTLLTEQEEEDSKSSAPQNRQRDRAPRGGQARRDDSAVLAQLTEKGWDKDQFVEGTVVSVLDFGAFVRINAATLNSEVEGDLDGLVHISALSSGRVDSVASVVKVDDKVQVRVKEIANKKVSLSMVAKEDEQPARDSSSGGSGPVSQEGNKNWQEDLVTVRNTMPTFKNRPLVVDRRK